MSEPTTKEYVYTKAHGMWASSFLVGRSEEVRTLKNVQDLYRVVFSEDPPLIPEATLTDLIEERLTSRTIRDFTRLLSMYDSSYPLLNSLLYEYELINLKVALSQLQQKNYDASFIIDIGEYSPLRWSEWPVLKNVTDNSIFSFFSAVVSQEKQVVAEMALDEAYCKAVMQALNSSSSQDYEACSSLVLKEFLLKNIVWMFRLRTYYDYKGEDLKKLLLGSWDEKSKKLLLHPLEEVIDKSISDHDVWKGWKYEWLVNPMQENEAWKLDPRYAQSVADRYLFNLALHNFHNCDNPVSLLFSFFKLKRGEEYFVRQTLEKLKVGMNMPFEAVMEEI